MGYDLQNLHDRREIRVKCFTLHIRYSNRVKTSKLTNTTRAQKLGALLTVGLLIIAIAIENKAAKRNLKLKSNGFILNHE